MNKQEPVAWQLLTTGHFRKAKPVNAEKNGWRPLYIHPKEWTGLTDKQKLSLEIQGGKADVLLAKLVEEWLRGNNNA
mgnify:CR=1 FL=1